MSYWKTMPVAVHSMKNEKTYKEIVSSTYILDKIERELEYQHVPFEVNIMDDKELDDKFYINMKGFFDKYYSNGDYQLDYSQEIYKYFCKNALIIVFNIPGTKKEIGYIIGRKGRLCIDSTKIDVLEVSFFCIAPEFRDNHYAPYFINILSKMSILVYDINVATYCVSQNIKSPFYGSKNNIHRPINIKRLVECEFLPNDFKDKSLEIFEKNNKYDLIYIRKSVPDDVITMIKRKLDEFQKKYFTIYRKFSVDDIKNILNNKSFHNFLIYNKDTLEIQDFISFYEIDIYVKNVKKKYKNSCIYMMFFEKYNLENIRSSLEMVSEYCSRHNIIDVLSFFDIFPVVDYYKDLKCLKGQGYINYYMFNYNMIKISNDKNGYMII